MKLLICTQAVDTNDSDLGFFVRWVEEFAKRCEQVEVLCLRRGEGVLPANVHVRVLPRGRLSRALALLGYAVRLHKQYDVVFVHMNPEYLVVTGLLWRLLGKKIALWYTHKSVTLKLRIAVLFAHVVFTASKESFRLRTSRGQVMGHGIDTDFFTPDPTVSRGSWALSVGRLMKSKRHDLAIRTAVAANRELRIAGEGPERKRLEALARELTASVHFLGGLTQAQLRDEYRHANHLIHTSETGSLDKVLLEALACGLVVKTNDPALTFLEQQGPEYVRAHHSLPKLIRAIVETLDTL